MKRMQGAFFEAILNRSLTCTEENMVHVLSSWSPKLCVCICLSLYPGRTNAHKHLQKLGTVNSDEGDVSLSRCCFGQKSFSCSGRTCQNGALRTAKILHYGTLTFENLFAQAPLSLYPLHLWDLGSQVLVLFRLLQEVNKLHDLKLGLLTTCHIFELDVNLMFQDLCRCLADAEQLADAPARMSRPCWTSAQREE